MKNQVWSRIRRPLAIAVVLVVWMGIMSERSYALFSDAATLTGNAIYTGTTELLVSNSQNPSSTVYDTTRPGFELNLNPGMFSEHYFLLKNMGADGVPLGIYAQIAASNVPQELLDAVTVEFTVVNSTGEPAGSPVSATLASLLSTPLPLQANVGPSNTVRFKMRTKLSTEYTHQGEVAQYDLILNGVQVIL